MDREDKPGNPESPVKLAPTEIAVDAWKALQEGRDVLAVLAVVGFMPALVSVLWDPLVVRLLDLEGFGERAGSWAVLGLAWATAAYVASHWHRFLLLGREDVRATLPRWTRAETRLFWWYVGFGVLSWVAGFVLALPLLLLFPLEGVDQPAWVGTALPWALLSGVAYLELRFCLAFPAAAVGGPSRGFPDSWRATVGNGWRLVAATALAFVPLAPLLMVVYYLLTAGGIGEMAGVALGAAAYILGIVLFAGVLSRAYRDLVLLGGPVPERPKAEADRPEPATEAGVRSLAYRGRPFEAETEDDESPPAVRF